MTTSPQKLKVAIDPRLKEEQGSELCWVWRLLLASIGYAWEEVPMGAAPCDIAYGLERRPGHRSRLYVRCDIEKWKNRSTLRLATLAHADDLSYPIYQGERASHPQLLQVNNGSMTCQRDVIFDIFWLATGQEERYWKKNKHGHFDLSDTVFEQRQLARMAIATGIGCWVERTMRNLRFAPPVPRWPNHKRAAACASHDVDYPEAIRWLEPLRVVHRLGYRGLAAAASVFLGTRKHWHFSSWVELEKSLNMHSAFYFVPQHGSLLQYAFGTPDPFYDIRSERFRKVFQYLANEGFEIGLHASYRAFEDCQRFANEKRLLGEISGQEICGNRHHYWHLNPADAESTLLMHEQIGLKYDASLAHERYVGWRRGLSWPFYPFHQKQRRELRTLQISTAWMDDQLFGHRRHNPGDRLAVLKGLADTAADQGGCLHVDVHDYVYDEVLFPAWAKTYRELLEYLVGRSDFWIDTPGAIADHWISRCEAIRQASRGLTGRTDL